MTYKWASLGLPIGGGKAVLALSRNLKEAERRELLKRYGDLLESLSGAFATGEDLGTTPDDMALIGERTRFVHGVNREDSSAIDPGPFTSHGVLSGMKACLQALFGNASPAGRKVLIQGLGDVGAPLARSLAQEGAQLQLCDMDAEKATRLAGELGGEIVSPESVYVTPCDVFAPCALGGILNHVTIPELACSIVAGSANNQLEEEEDGERLHRRRILAAPDYVINGGGALALGLMSAGEPDPVVIMKKVEGIGVTIGEILEESKRRDESPYSAAIRRVRRILSKGRETARAD